ncbi:hypothetical protein MLD38_025137 [Melastoma candidum]|uniref:Uncharacterized protein n=1 Tax=Melastoma candidum TaxID=119954 RepID=A0ACB9NW58_9MYRT|nr:hypothetical protein MLD38_025137 [Melastoma candidum]
MTTTSVLSDGFTLINPRRSKAPYVYVPVGEAQPGTSSQVGSLPLEEPRIPVVIGPSYAPQSTEVELITRSRRVVVAPEAQPRGESSRPKAPSSEQIRKVIYAVNESDYNIVEQLRKQPAQISLLDLIHSSDKHREMLEKFLVEVELGVNLEKLPPSSLTIRAFEGAKRHAYGEAALEIKVGPTPFSSVFQILETAGSFNMLLGRQWIHQAGAIPSTLHQMVHFPADGKLVTVKGEHTMELCHEIDMPYVGESVGEPSTTQALEMVNMVRRDFKSDPLMTPGNISATKQFIKFGYQLGQRLGAWGQGIRHLIDVPVHPGRVVSDLRVRDGGGQNALSRTYAPAAGLLSISYAHRRQQWKVKSSQGKRKTSILRHMGKDKKMSTCWKRRTQPSLTCHSKGEPFQLYFFARRLVKTRIG